MLWPKTFAKLIKLLIDTLRLDAKIIAIYIDHLINVRLKLDECVENVITSIIFLNSPGFPSRQIYILTKTGNNIFMF